jgi:hypothetical protein
MRSISEATKVGNARFELSADLVQMKYRQRVGAAQGIRNGAVRVRLVRNDELLLKLGLVERYISLNECGNVSSLGDRHVFAMHEQK